MDTKINPKNFRSVVPGYVHIKHLQNVTPFCFATLKKQSKEKNDIVTTLWLPAEATQIHKDIPIPPPYLLNRPVRWNKGVVVLSWKPQCKIGFCLSVSQDLIVDQTIEKVSFCAPDRNYDKAFSYICRDGTTRRWMCHCFMALKDSVRRRSAFHAPLSGFSLKKSGI